MVMEIWRFEIDSKQGRLAPNGIIMDITMPIGAKILSVQTKRGVPQMWALVDPKAKTRTRRFRIFGTGEPIPYVYEYKYLGTFLVTQEMLVWHIFEDTLYQNKFKCKHERTDVHDGILYCLDCQEKIK